MRHRNQKFWKLKLKKREQFEWKFMLQRVEEKKLSLVSE